MAGTNVITSGFSGAAPVPRGQAGPQPGGPVTTLLARASLVTGWRARQWRLGRRFGRRLTRLPPALPSALPSASPLYSLGTAARIERLRSWTATTAASDGSMTGPLTGVPLIRSVPPGAAGTVAASVPK